MAKFSDLSLRAQRELMEEYRNKGINDLSDMIADYDMEKSSDTTSSGTSVSVPFSLAETYRNGGKIHIKPENRGKFTALKKRTGHSASWFKAHGTPAQKKMAVFALNARKWKHGDGGFLKNYFELGGPEGGNWFTRATLNAAMADSPAVMQSMGWEPTNKGPVQGDWSAPGPTALRESLAEIATIPLTDGLVDLAGAAITGSRLYKSYKVAKALKDAAKESAASTASASRSGVTNEIFRAPVYKGGEVSDVGTEVWSISPQNSVTEVMTPSSKVITGTDVEVEALRNRFNRWAEYYGYDKIPESYTVEQAEEQMRKTFDRHNTFFRGLQKPFLEEDIESLDKILGKDRTYDETMAYMATHGKPDYGAVFVSPKSNAAIYGGGENTAIIRRNYSLGDNPSRWLQDADFDIVYGNAVGGRTPEELNKMFSELPSNKILFPWSSSGNGIVENEVLIPSGRASFVGYVPVDNPIEYIEANGSLNKYLGNKFYFGYDMGIPLEKPKFGDGGFLQQYPDGGKIKGKRNGKFYVTELNDRREKKFRNWYADAAATLGLDPNPDAYEHAYDYRGYWLNNRDADVSSPDFHFPDTWKQPHHPTFSNESIYAKGHKGVGHWEGETFVPGPFNNIMQATDVFPEPNPFNYEEGYSLIDAARRIREVENSKDNPKGGYDSSTGRWYPHRSHEGGADTVAYGIKLSNGTPEAALAKQQGYLTDAQANEAVDSLVRTYGDSAKKVYNKKFGEGAWDDLSEKSKSILIDYEYNPGLSKFPNLMTGFHDADLEKIKANYKRYSRGKELGRNKTLARDIDSLSTFYPILGK